MTAIVILDSPSFGPLALDMATIEQAQQRAREMLPVQQQPRAAATEDRILTAEQAADLTGVPASWFEEQMRRDRLEHLQFGKYRRLRLSTVLSYTASKAERTPPRPKNRPVSARRYRGATTSTGCERAVR